MVFTLLAPLMELLAPNIRTITQTQLTPVQPIDCLHGGKGKGSEREKAREREKQMGHVIAGRVQLRRDPEEGAKGERRLVGERAPLICSRRGHGELFPLLQ